MNYLEQLIGVRELERDLALALVDTQAKVEAERVRLAGERDAAVDEVRDAVASFEILLRRATALGLEPADPAGADDDDVEDLRRISIELEQAIGVYEATLAAIQIERRRSREDASPPAPASGGDPAGAAVWQRAIAIDRRLLFAALTVLSCGALLPFTVGPVGVLLAVVLGACVGIVGPPDRSTATARLAERLTGTRPAAPDDPFELRTFARAAVSVAGAGSALAGACLGAVTIGDGLSLLLSVAGLAGVAAALAVVFSRAREVI